jgi:hypothetical protein
MGVVHTAGDYALTLRHAANAAGGGLRFAFNGQAPGDPIAIPFGAPNSTGATDWKDWIADTVALVAGVQSMAAGSNFRRRPRHFNPSP